LVSKKKVTFADHSEGYWQCGLLSLLNHCHSIPSSRFRSILHGLNSFNPARLNPPRRLLQRRVSFTKPRQRPRTLAWISRASHEQFCAARRGTQPVGSARQSYDNSRGSERRTRTVANENPSLRP